MSAKLTETPRQKFKRLSTARLAKVEEEIHKLANLTNCSIYEFNDEDRRVIFNRILESLEVAERKFILGVRKGERLRSRRHEETKTSLVEATRKRRPD